MCTGFDVSVKRCFQYAHVIGTCTCPSDMESRDRAQVSSIVCYRYLLRCRSSRYASYRRVFNLVPLSSRYIEHRYRTVLIQDNGFPFRVYIGFSPIIQEQIKSWLLNVKVKPTPLSAIYPTVVGSPLKTHLNWGSTTGDFLPSLLSDVKPMFSGFSLTVGCMAEKGS